MSESNLSITNANPNAKLLIVDDNLTLLDILKDSLTEAGFKVDAVSNGYDALYKINVNVYDIVIIDNIMPTMNGMQLVDYIRVSEQNANVSIMVHSAILEDLQVTSAYSRGIKRYIVKPCPIPQLIQTINEVMEESKLPDEPYPPEISRVFMVTVKEVFKEYFPEGFSPHPPTTSSRQDNTRCYISFASIYGSRLYGSCALGLDERALFQIYRKESGPEETIPPEPKIKEIKAKIMREIGNSLIKNFEDMGFKKMDFGHPLIFSPTTPSEITQMVQSKECFIPIDIAGLGGFFNFALKTLK